ncbi:hypothetical protein F5144DRAFT_87907 [Chaetomium tenue]|uniref:Uncharacterized protein n=1 Tax=Chaetomium tenue TaxID=1854479 RepID=A0ACB7PIH2_9PEZI|nr:hypothetical protein F5144DRAFT_87907 [Chaetomium globosum]
MKGSWLWITGFAVLSIAANVVFLISCMSPATKNICLYRVNVTLLADGLHRLAVVDGGNETDFPLTDELPTYWYWGMSGMCDVFETTGETNCRRAFPPTKNVLGTLEDSLTDRLGNDQGRRINEIVSSWNATLSNISPGRLAANEARVAARTKASAALVIIAIVLDAISPFLALCLLGGSKKRHSYVAPFLSSLMAIVAGALAVLSMRDGVHGILDTSEHGGPAIIILFVGAALRLLSCGGASKGPDTPSNRPRLNTNEEIGLDSKTPPGHPKLTRNEEIGLQGEHYIHSWLRDLPGWSYKNWTSHLRFYADHPEFKERPGQHADFTYEDHQGQLLQELADAGAEISPDWRAGTTYHLEVKTTPAGCGTTFLVSRNQVRLMQDYSGDPRNAYILVRIFQIGRNPAMEFFPDPLSHPGLVWGPLNDNGDYPVHTRS